MQSEQRELALRVHIRNLLLDYSLTHLTTNYVTWTQDTVNELLSERLSYVPATDPTDLLLPSDTYENLLRIWKLEEIQPYNETFKADARALQVLKTHLQACSRRERPTVECWDDDTDVDYEQWLMSRPMSPVLSSASIRQTPRPGSLTGAKNVPRDLEGVLRSNNLKVVRCEDLPEEPPPKLQDVLRSKLPVDGQMQKDIAALFKSVAFLSSRQPASSDVHEEAKAFLRADSPPIELPRMASPPLFPRDRQPGYNASSRTSLAGHGLGDLADLPAIVPTAAPGDETEEELYKQHMVVVDGWQAFAVPSSPLTPGTPSFGDSSSDIDELMLPSSPCRNRPLIEEIMDARLDEYEIPRSRNIGGTQDKPKTVGHGQSLSSFLSPLRRRHDATLDQAKIVTTPKSHPSSPHTAITASMLGQPPTMLEGRGAGGSDFTAYSDPPSEGSDPDTSILLRRIYGPDLATADVTQVVMAEKIDEGEGLLMNVPILLPPNEHMPTTMFLPRAPEELLAPAKSKPDRAEPLAVTPSTQPGHLKKTKGLQALTIELSWIPFKYGASVPTDDEATGVAGSIGYALAAALQDEDPALGTELAELLDGALNLETCKEDEEDTPSVTRYMYDDYDSVGFGDTVGDVDVILTREERRALRGDVEGEDQELDSSDKENEGPADPPYEPDEEEERPQKRVRRASTQGEAHSDELDQAALAADDSGIFLSPLEVPSGGYTGGFVELGYDAQGFEGPDADGDLFNDLDPIHELGFENGVNIEHAVRDVPRHADHEISDRRAPWVAGQDAEIEMAIPHARSTMGNLAAEVSLADQTSIHNKSDWGISKTASVLEGPENSVTVHLETRRLAPTSIASGDPSAALPSARRTLSDFLVLMGKKNASFAQDPNSPTVDHSNDDAPDRQVQEGLHHDRPVNVPADLLNPDVLVLPESGLQSTTMHRYMASIALLQKRVLVRCFSSSDCCVDLIEREDLGDADLILDPDTAVVFAPLAALPTQVNAVLARLTRLSWRYRYILLVLEAYPDSLSFKNDPTSPRVMPYPFSAAVVKAAKKLRRDINVAKACETMRAESSISVAYAVTVEQAASYARLFGEHAQSRDTTKDALWGTREWLESDEQEGEIDLAGVDGMNTFAASIILSQMSLDDFLDTSPEDRVQYFGPYVGHDRLARFNEELEKRARAVQMASSPPGSIGSRTPA